MTEKPSETTTQKCKCAQHGEDNRRIEQGIDPRSIRYAFQQAGLQSGRAVLVIELHSTHSAHIAPGRDGLFNLNRSTPPTLKYEPGLIVAENDYVVVHGRFSGPGRSRNWIAADVVRVADGVLAEHWDVLQDEATKAESRSGLPMFGTTFPE
jgi:predicted SnoaL-like aldol condensation-catalyzing enzyme